MKYIISTGYSIISKTVWRDNTLVGFSVSVEDNPAKFDAYGDAMTVCIKVNNLIGKPVFKVMPLHK